MLLAFFCLGLEVQSLPFGGLALKLVILALFLKHVPDHHVKLVLGLLLAGEYFA